MNPWFHLFIDMSRVSSWGDIIYLKPIWIFLFMIHTSKSKNKQLIIVGVSVCLFSKKQGEMESPLMGQRLHFEVGGFLRRPPVTQLFRQAIGCWACRDMGVSLNGGTPKSPILIGFSIINHPFWDTTVSGNPHIPIDLHVVIHQKLSDTRYLNCFLLPRIFWPMDVFNVLWFYKTDYYEMTFCHGILPTKKIAN